MRRFALCAALALCLFMMACTGLTPELQQEQAELAVRIAELGKLIEAGLAEPVDYGELATAIARQKEIASMSDGGIDWSVLPYHIIDVLAAVGIVELRRGSPNNRKGKPPAA